MKKNKLHHFFAGILLCSFLFCVSSAFTFSSTANHKQHKEVRSLKNSIKTDSFYSELEEDEECNFSVLKSLFVINRFIKNNIEQISYNKSSIVDLSVLNYKLKQPIYIINSIFRL